MTGVSSSCGACKFLRRKCTSECIFAPYFSYDQAASHFAAVHKVFGASNASRLLLHLPEHCRSEAALTMSYEALARMQDPVYGCVAHIFSLQQQVVDLQEEIELLGSHMACISGKVAGSGDPLVTSSIDEGLQFYSQACLPDIQECMKPQMGPPAATCMTVHHIPGKVAGSGDTPVTNNIDEGLQFSSRACLPDIEDYMTPQIEQPEATGTAVHIPGKIAGSGDPRATNGMNDGLQFFPQACLPTIQEYMESQGLRGNTVHQISSYYPNIPPQPTNEGQNLHTTFYPSPSETLLGQVSQETSEYCPWIFNGMQP